MNIQTTDYLITIVVVILNFFLTSLLAKKLEINFTLNLFINALVCLCALYKFNLEYSNPSDSSFYYESGLFGVNFNFGTDFISYCSGLLSNHMQLGFMPIYFIFSIFCIFSVHTFYKTFLIFGGLHCSYILRWLLTTLIIIPVCFWGAGLNKEGIALLGVALFCFSMKDQNLNKTQIFFSILLLMISRPHIGIIAIFSILLGVIVSKNSKAFDRFTVSILGTISLAFLIPLVLTYIGVEELSSNYLTEYVDVRSVIYSDTSGYINIIDMSPPLRILSYMFRPLPWESTSAIQFLASLLNVGIIISIVYMNTSFYKSKKSIFTMPQISYLLFILGGLVVLGMTTSNLGISNRQKWMMIIPFLIMMLTRLEIDKKLHQSSEF